jgi:carbonic anhydrase
MWSDGVRVQVIVVMGHGGCGAVKATIQAKEVPGQIGALYPHIQPTVDQAGSDPGGSN